jgi:hypothetical protein
MSKLFILGVMLTAIGVGSELALAQLTHGRSAAPIAADSVRMQQDSLVQRGVNRIGRAIQADSLASEMNKLFERR